MSLSIGWPQRLVAVVTGAALWIGAGAAEGARAEDPSCTALPATEDTPPATGPAPGTRFVDVVFDEVTVVSGLCYGEAANTRDERQTLRLDLYLPTGDPADGRPAVLFAHGGGFREGARDEARHRPYLLGLAQRGYVVGSIDYRLRPPGSPGSIGGPQRLVNSLVGDDPGIADAQHDMQAAVRWVRAHAAGLRVNPALVIVSGSSAGAVTAWQVGVNAEDPGDSGTPDQPSSVAAVVALWGAPDPDHIEAGAAPVIDVHGTHDRIVPAPLATAACGVAMARGNVCEQVVIAGADHVVWEELDAIFEEATGFLCRTVLDACEAPAPAAPIRPLQR